MQIYYSPNGGVAADVIPFFWQGEYHLFYLKDYRDEAGHGPGTPWEHIGTRDFTRFSEYPQALARGNRDAQDLWVFTGSLIERDGLFHIFYTGHNAFYTKQEPRHPQEAIMHATSHDLQTWQKDPANPILFADPERYELDDWRDPFVFWNAEAGEYWMLLAARLRTGPLRRRGCIALATSPDLAAWTVRDPFWAPHLYYTHECPDLFRMGDWWYLVYSTFSERQVTHYRQSRSLAGPWTAPTNDTFDGRAFYAAKTVSDGTRRFVCGWNPTRDGETDSGRWQWGGNIVTHELQQAADGSLTVHMPPEVDALFTRLQPTNLQPLFGSWQEAEGSSGLAANAGDGYAACRLGNLPQRCRITARLECTPGTRACGILLHSDEQIEAGYEVRWEPGRQRLVVDRWPRPGDQPFMLEQPLDLPAGEPLELRLYIEGTLVEIYAANRIALSTRTYDHRTGHWGLFVYEGQCQFSEYSISK